VAPEPAPGRRPASRHHPRRAGRGPTVSGMSPRAGCHRRRER
jgi:hypothetical protein